MNKSKIFLLISLLITFIMIFSFTALYFILPQVYLYSKNHTINKNAKILAENLSHAGQIRDCRQLISDFSQNNNAMVFSFDKHGDIINELSSISMMMDEGPMQIRIITSNVGSHRISIGSQAPGGNLAPGGNQPSNRTQSFFVTRDASDALFIEREIGGAIIDKITISSLFQPISEAKSVVLMLSPFLLLLDILLGLLVAYFYLKREEQYAQNKTDFMRAAHHELKTPLAALNGIVEGMIDNVGVYKNRDEYLGKTKEILDRLTLLTNDILNATQSMSRTIPKETVKVGDLFDEVINQHQFQLEDKELYYHPFQFHCKTNRILLGNVFSNLISNAARYSTGKINISFAQNTLTIANECPPLEETDLVNIFEPFYTLSQSRDKSQSGNGIGLYIVKRNLEALKHKFAFRNTETGVEFQIFFQPSQ